MSGLIAYWLAWQYTQHVVDRSLADLATAISKQIQIAGADAPVTVPPLAQAMFSDPDRTTDLPDQRRRQPKSPATRICRCTARTCAACITRTCSKPTPGRDRARGAGARGSAARQSDRRGGGAARGHRGIEIAAEFLVAIMMPLLLLLLAGWVIVWRVVNQQLNPLTDLADSLNRQTHTSLEPVDETYVPVEIRPLTGALNALLDRLKTALDGQRKFIADAAHQLRTPLTAVKLHAEQAATARDPQRRSHAVQRTAGRGGSRGAAVEPVAFACARRAGRTGRAFRRIRLSPRSRSKPARNGCRARLTVQRGPGLPASRRPRQRSSADRARQPGAAARSASPICSTTR